MGWIADRWGWNGVFVAMVACRVLTMAFTALTLRGADRARGKGSARERAGAPVGRQWKRK